MTDPTLPDELRGEHAHLFVPHIDAPEARSRTADLSPAGIADLADAIAREGLLQPIGVVKGSNRYRLIWGLRRLTAYQTHADRLGPEIQAMVYRDDLPLEWAKVLEIDENARRQDLTPDERAAHTVELAAEIKKIESQAEAGKSDLSDFTSAEPAEDKPTTGRGHKGIYQKVAERQKIDQAAVRKRERKVAERIGEPVDLQKDSPAELTRKAAKFRTIKTPRAGGKGAHVMTAGTKAAGPSLLDAMGAVVAFTPASAKRWLAEHPDDAKKVAGMVGSVAALVEVLQPDTKPAVAEPEPEHGDELVAAMITLGKKMFAKSADPGAWWRALDYDAQYRAKRTLEDLLLRLGRLKATIAELDHGKQPAPAAKGGRNR